MQSSPAGAGHPERRAEIEKLHRHEFMARCRRPSVSSPNVSRRHPLRPEFKPAARRGGGLLGVRGPTSAGASLRRDPPHADGGGGRAAYNLLVCPEVGCAAADPATGRSILPTAWKRPACPASYPLVRRSVGGRCPCRGKGRRAMHVSQGAESGGKTTDKRSIYCSLPIVFALPAGCQNRGEPILSPPPLRLNHFAHPHARKPSPPPPRSGGEAPRG